MRATGLARVLLALLALVLVTVVHATPAPETPSPVATPSPVVTRSPTPPTRPPTRAPTKSPTVKSCPEDPTDSDMDGTTDCNDKCPEDFNKVNPGLCGCGVSDTLVDLDRDGHPECPDGKKPNLIKINLNSAPTTAQVASGVVGVVAAVALNNVL